MKRGVIPPELIGPCCAAILDPLMTRPPDLSVDSSDRRSKTIDALSRTYSASSESDFVVEAPLRICPLGAHVDHQGGVVTGMTVDRGVVLAAAPSSDSIVRMSSLDFPGEIEVELGGEVHGRTGDWGDYVRAAVQVLSNSYDLRRGLRGVIGGDLPGAGLSSSAAVVISYLLALTHVNEIEITRKEVSALAQQAENAYVGVDCGRLDQSIILFAEHGHLTCVDCSNLKIEQVANGAGSRQSFEVLVAFSGLYRTLSGSGFNDRVGECREAARLLLEMSGRPPGARPILSEVRPEVFERFAADLPGVARRRATHYFSEQQRVADGIEAWRQGDLDYFGELINASGESSVHNYECGTPELATLSDLLRKAEGVFGARFSGGGFGGSCIALIKPGAGESVITAVSRGYGAVHPEAAERARFHICAGRGSAKLDVAGA